MKGKKNKKKTIFMVIGVIFLLYVGFWQFKVGNRYDRYEEKLDAYEKSLKKIEHEEKRYTLGVHRPMYLGYTGNLYICENLNFDEVGKSFVSLIIWPGIFQKDEVGVSITYCESEENMVEVNIYLNDRFEPVEKTEENMELYRKNKEKILSVIQMAEDIWGDCK